ncbi:YjcQ family protein [Fictibacillus gelatini]|uniref:YjcQ family protein n=1 Tax=Fictibacillus gelatini TaxID=225985 RepID=UPI00248040C6|nr:YjcQ family protein [Fictibacillus gelatini]
MLKEIDNGNNNLTENDFDVDSDVFDEAISFLKREGYLDGIFYADNRPCLFEGTVYVTEKGEKYLSDNSKLSKTYNGLKEIRDWMKL